MSNGFNWGFSLTPNQNQNGIDTNASDGNNNTKHDQQKRNEQGHQQRIVPNQKSQQDNLTTINEASRENSEASSRKTSVATGTAVDRRKSNWWPWGETVEEDASQPASSQQPIPQASQEGNNGITQEREASPLSQVQISETETFWSPTYRRMSSVVSYIYPGIDSTIQSTNNETTPLLENGTDSTKHSEESSPSPEQSSWFSWVWNPFGSSENDDGEANSDDDLLRSARLAIEANKDSLHYAFRNNRSQSGSAYGELSVSHTKTENQPVRYKYKKVPLIPNQIQENSLQPAPYAPAAAAAPTNPTVSSGTNAIGNKTTNKNHNTQLDPSSHLSAQNQTNSPLVNGERDQLILNGASNSGSGANSEVTSPNLNNGSATFGKPPSKQTSPVPVASSASSIISTRSILSTYRKFLVTPTVDENFRHLTVRTKLRLLGEHFLFKDQTSEAHLYKSTESNIATKKANKIRKIVIIGIHGFFPFKMVKALIGESTGNSMRFTDEATKSIYKWLECEDIEDDEEVEIDTISLEGKGKISSRVDNLYKLLLNWVHLISNCDFLFVIGHSQGSAVAIHLLAKLIEMGHLRPSMQKIGLLSMSGILQGPFQGLDNKIVIRAYTTTEKEILNELFEFQKPASQQSVMLQTSIQKLIGSNVKITLSGSINDQLIPMYSSLCIDLRHPNLFRCINVSENCDYPNFMIVLIKIILMLMNLGHGEFGLLSELSKICMGSISKGGHSKIYLNNEIYFNSIKHAIETTSLNHLQPLKKSVVNTTRREATSSTASSVRRISSRESLVVTNTAPSNTLGTGNATAAGGTAGSSKLSPPPLAQSLLTPPTNGAATSNSISSNIYLLPWYIRELLQELAGTKHINSVALTRELLYEYRHWEPTQKHWKDVKYCLEALEEFDLQELYS